jgi:plastocyanin
MAHKYVPSVGEKAKIELNPDAQLFKVKPGELTRWYILAPGPNEGVSFHFISGQIDVRDGSIMNRYGTQLRDDETWWIPAGSGSVIEATFPEEGVYVGVDHNMAHVVKGGAIAVLAAANATDATAEATDTDHPAGTWVPPKGSMLVSGPSMMNETGGANATGIGNMTATETGNTTVTGNATTATGTGNMTAAGAGNATTTTGNMTSNATTGAMPDNTTTSTGPMVPAPTSATGGGGGGGNSVEVSIPQGSSTLSEGAYDPNPVQVSAGGTVTWTNNDAQPHTATSGENAAPDGVFDSSILAAGKSFSHTFAEAGEYPYYCMLHPNMVGTVSVS